MLGLFSFPLRRLLFNSFVIFTFIFLTFFLQFYRYCFYFSSYKFFIDYRYCKNLLTIYHGMLYQTDFYIKIYTNSSISSLSCIFLLSTLRILFQKLYTILKSQKYYGFFYVTLQLYFSYFSLLCSLCMG